jgi:TRAP-type mannitol/chloroaromatic compound transport system permease small subunit
MPSLSFVLPHWLYWSVLILFPVVALWLIRRQAGRRDAGRPNYFLAYLFLVTAGFIGMHRFYLKNAWGFVFIPVFLAVLWTSAEVRDAREDVSRTRAAAESSERFVKRSEQDVTRKKTGAEEKLKKAQAEREQTGADYKIAQAEKASADAWARGAAIVMALMLLGDAFLVPRLVRRARAVEPPPPAPLAQPMETAVPEHPGAPPRRPGIPAIDTLSRLTGEFVAYWGVLAVFAYYYEVVGRYVFNSPTNWVHESMFLMFGMQYMIAGAYAYRDETHVRVDILYSQLSVRGRAVCDLITSAFFFLFTGTMLVSGWRFAADAINFNEHSFTEWEVQYWPVKLMIPIGAALLILQGISRLVRDAAIVFRRREA